MVLRNAVTTRHLRATAIRSWLRISLQTAAAISGVTPGASAASAAASAASLSSQSRKSPTVSARSARRPRRRGVDDQPRDLVGFVGDDQLGEEGGQRQVGQHIARRHPFRRRPRRHAGQPSPDRAGLAAAITAAGRRRRSASG